MKRFSLLGRGMVLAFLTLLGLGVGPALGGPATIDAGALNQPIRGFGASSAWASGWSAAQMDSLFSVTNGIGLSMLRHRIPPNNPVDVNAGAALLQGARDRGVTQIWATCWSPPAAWKSNNNVNGPGTGNCNTPPVAYLLSQYYDEYATWLADYVINMRNNNAVTLFAISPQNEPNWCPAYEASYLTGAQFQTLVRDNIGPTFQARGIGGVSIIIPEPLSTNDLATLSNPCMNDANCRRYLLAIATHLYGTPNPVAYPAAATNGKEYWETEMSSFETYNGTMSNALTVVGWIHNSMVNANMNAFHFWWAISDQTNEGLTSQTMGHPKRYYAFGNYSKFIRPGFRRIGSPAPSGGVSISAYSGGTSIVIVAINGSGGAINQQFNLTGMNVASFTPWITDGSRNLASQAAVAVSANSFTYSLPAQSIVSFVGTGPAGPTATFTVSPTRTNTPIPGAFCLVDDVEDLNTTNLWNFGWGTYQGTGSAVTLTMAAGGAAGSTAGAASITGTIGTNDYGGVYTGLVNTGVTNISNYIGVVFMAKGNGGNYWFQVPNDAVTTGDHYGVTFTAPAAWTPVTLLFSNAVQRGFGTGQPFDLTQVTSLQWGGAAAGTLNFQIDDVRLLGAFCPGGTPTATRTSTPTVTRTSTSTLTRTMTATSTLPANTPTPTRTNSPTATRTTTPSATSTSTNTPVVNTSTPTRTNSSTPSSTATSTRTSTSTNTAPANTSTPTATRTSTNTAVVNTPTPTRTNSSSPTATPSVTRTSTSTNTPPANTSTPTSTRTSTNTAVINTATSTRTNSSTTTPTSTRTPSSTPTQTISPTQTSTATSTNTGQPTATSTSTLTRTNTLVPTSTPTATSTASPTSTRTLTSTPTASSTSTSSRTPTASSTHTVTRTLTASPTITNTGQPTATNTDTQVNTPTASRTATPSTTSTTTSTSTLVPTVTSTSSLTPTLTISPTSTNTGAPTATRTNTPLDTFTSTPSATSTLTASPTQTATLTSTNTGAPTATRTSTATLTQTLVSTPTSSPTSTRTATPSSTGTATASSTSTNTLAATATASRTATATSTASSTRTLTASPTGTSTSTSTPTGTATSTITLTPSPTVPATATPSPTATVRAGSTPIVFPNPITTGVVDILPQAYSGPSDVTVQIFTSAFKLVAQKTYPSLPAGQIVRMDLVDNWGQVLGNGLYYLCVTTGKDRKTTNLIIVR